MKRVIKKKRIIILHRGLIQPLGISGPHLVPYWETTANINKLIMGNYKIAEVLKDGTEVILDFTNYDKENGDPDDPSMQVSYEQYKSNIARRREKDKRIKSIADTTTTKSEMERLLKRSTEKKPINQTTNNLVAAEKIIIDDDNHNKNNDNRHDKKNKFKRPEIDLKDDK